MSFIWKANCIGINAFEGQIFASCQALITQGYIRFHCHPEGAHSPMRERDLKTHNWDTVGCDHDKFSPRDRQPRGGLLSSLETATGFTRKV